MKRRVLISTVAATLLSNAFVGLAGNDEVCTDPTRLDSFACREIVVEANPGGFDWIALANKYNLRLVGLIPELDTGWFEAPVGTSDILGLVLAIGAETGVHEAETNGDFIPPECRQLTIGIMDLGTGAGPLFQNQPALTTLRMPENPSPRLGEGVIVAVLDTGVSQERSELGSSLLLPGIAFEASQTGYANDTGDGIDQDGNGSADDGWGHGTAVASLIHLIAPGAKILPVKVLDDECRGRAFAIASGIVQAVKRGARVLNLSFGSHDGSGTVRHAIEWANSQGAIVVAPTGNDGEEDLQSPADRDETFSVAAVDDSLRATTFTNYKKGEVDIAAPGLDVVAYRRDSIYRVSGTSLAVAFVSGAAAIVVQAHPGYSAAQIELELTSTAIPVDALNPGLEEGALGAGIPNLGELARSFAARPRLGVTPPSAPLPPLLGAPTPLGAGSGPLPVVPTPTSAP